MWFVVMSIVLMCCKQTDNVKHVYLFICRDHMIKTDTVLILSHRQTQMTVLQLLSITNVS